MRTRAIAIALLLILNLGSAAQVWALGGAGPSPSMGPFGSGPVWSDSLDDLSHVYVPTGGLVGVEVVGGEAHLKTGSATGWIASSIITCPGGYRHDLVLLEAYLPGKSHVNVTILDASKAPTLPSFANETVPGFVNITATDVSVFSLDPVKYPSIRIQVDLFANGTDRPRLLSWSLRFIDLGEWQDEFLGTGKMKTHIGLNITGGTVELDRSGSGTAPYDPYPPIVFPDPAGDVDTFYSNTAGDGYAPLTTISNSGEVTGLECDDLNGDGYLDLIAVGGASSTGNPTAFIFWGDSSGKWSTSNMLTLNILNSGTDAAVGDFNGDGAKDIAIACVGGMMGDSYCFLNQGNGAFNANPDVTFKGVQATTVAAGDVNNDGIDDIVFDQTLLTLGSCYYGSKNGPDATEDMRFLGQITTHAYVGGVLIKDIDKDGFPDVLFATKDDNGDAPIYLGSAGGVDNTVDITLPIDDEPMDVSVGDVNGDGYLDIVYTTQDASGVNNDKIYIFEGTAAGWDKAHLHTIMDGTGLDPIEVVDIDKDGYDDIVTGDDSTLDIYLGGTAWPTAASITENGLDYPEDVVVAVPRGSGGGGFYQGYFVTEPIPLPAGMRWDIAYLEADVPAGGSVSISVLDSKMAVVPGFGRLVGPDVDLSGLGTMGSINVRVDVHGAINGSTPVLHRLLVDWIDKLSWRDQFYGRSKVQSTMGLDLQDLQLQGPADTTSAPDLLFASLRGDFSYDTRSVALLNAGNLDYSSLAPLYLNTTGASALDTYDVDGDGLQDIAFASYGTADTTFSGMSPLFLGSPAGWYQHPYHTFATTGARDVAVTDLNRDGHADVVFAQERDSSGPDVESILFWGSAAGWNSTPDVEFSTHGASGIEAVDVDGDGRLDLAFACYEDDLGIDTDSMVFLQSPTGFCGTVPSYLLATSGARAVASGDLDRDGRMDLVFANFYDGLTYAVDSSIYWGNAGGGFQAAPMRLHTLGANDIKAADLNGDGALDLVFANGHNATEGLVGESYVYMNDGTGHFGPSPSARLPTTNAVAVAVTDLDGLGRKDLVFASEFNDTGFASSSVVYLGGASGWSPGPDAVLHTMGASDVMALLLSDPTRGGYLSRPITPDAADDVGTFEALRYTATLGATVSGTVRLVDAITGETLFEAQLESGGSTLDLRDAFSYRQHPSVRALVTVQGLAGHDGFAFDDLVVNWSKRVLAPPQVLGMGLTNTTCYRGHTVEMWVNVTDEYDAPGMLTVRVEHQLLGETAWRSYMLGTPTFDGGLWHLLVAPDRFVPPGQYSFRVNVTDSDGLSSGYRQLPETLLVLSNLPNAPTLIKATGQDGKVLLEWRPPQDPGDLAVVGYHIYRGPTIAGLTILTTIDSPVTLTYLDGAVSNGVTYYYAVAAFNDLGNSSLSGVLDATPMGLPSEPRNVTTEVGDGHVKLTWEGPLLNGGRPVLGYYVYRAVGDGPMERHAEVCGTSYEENGLTNGVVYRFKVSAFTAFGEGPSTDVLNLRPLGLPGAPTGLAVQVAIKRLNVTWQAPSQTGGGAISGYAVYRGEAEELLSRLIQLAGDVTSLSDSDVVVGHTYYYAVTALTAAGEGPRSQIWSGKVIDLPGAPQNLTATAGDGNLSLSWDPPSYDGATPVTGYVVLRGATSQGLEEIAQLGPVTSYQDTGLSNGLTYYYAIVVVNAAGRGAATQAIGAKPVKPVFPPGTPTRLLFSIKDGKVLLQWTPPTSDGGSPIIGYVVLRGNSSNNLSAVGDIGLVTSWTDTTAKKGTTYYYSVVAKNAVGQGDRLAAIEVKVPKAKAKTPGLEAPAALLAIAAVTLTSINRRRRG